MRRIWLVKAMFLNSSTLSYHGKWIWANIPRHIDDLVIAFSHLCLRLNDNTQWCELMARALALHHPVCKHLGVWWRALIVKLWNQIKIWTLESHKETLEGASVIGTCTDVSIHIVWFLWNLISIDSKLSDSQTMPELFSLVTFNESIIELNPVFTGGGGSIWPSRARNLWLRQRTPLIATRFFMTFFLQCVAYLLIRSLRKSDHRSRGHATFCTRTSAHIICPKSAFCICLCTKTHGNYSFWYNGYWIESPFWEFGHLQNYLQLEIDARSNFKIWKIE